MQNIFTLVTMMMALSSTFAQSSGTELHSLISKLLYDSTGYSNVGDWAVGTPSKFPVKWKEDRIIMSDDTSINFYRLGSANVKINGRPMVQNGQPVKWNVMLKGPRMGYTSFSIISSPSSQIKPKWNIDSLMGQQKVNYKLLKKCDDKELTGFYYYEVKFPRKDIAYLKLSWLSVNGNNALRIDGYDSYSNYAAKLDCPK